MASVSATSIRFSSSLKPAILNNQKSGRFSSVKLVSSVSKKIFPSLRSQRFQICCAAKPETVAKVKDIVKKQLALSEDTALTAESTFASLGADSLDTVEIVMGLEEEFGITVEEDNSQTISTVQDAAELIDKLVDEKAGSA
ncbi:acyl carrier protein 1, chloroplastic-like [Iris pallida]|uniref:Acyl carrier protein n=1 Tax=Iris pallida TaxID=29817 RepID=A0AAX6F0X1_IRIPA|nr:acyl carrier protein 1, chloroplastic-like [Iris pallida]KAJ6809986.1 acyl carrier protein 1, chloroplastic-like [Iris pallida]